MSIAQIKHLRILAITCALALTACAPNKAVRSTEAVPVARADRAAETGWKKPWEEPPPKGTKLFLLTAGRCATTGLWGKDCIAWAPLFTLDEELREYAHAVFMGRGEEFRRYFSHVGEDGEPACFLGGGGNRVD